MAQRQKIIPISEYFSEMDLDEEQIKDREDLADELNKAFKFIFAAMLLDYQMNSELNRLVYSDMLVRRYLDAVETKFSESMGHYSFSESDLISGRLYEYIQSISDEIIGNTVDNIDNAYYTSEDRALFCAENEANTVYDDADYQEAIESGCTEKTWHTIIDKHTRDSHRNMDGETVPMDEYFSNGLMYPHDIDGDPSEVVNCRCSCTYS